MICGAVVKVCVCGMWSALSYGRCWLAYAPAWEVLPGNEQINFLVMINMHNTAADQMDVTTMHLAAGSAYLLIDKHESTHQLSPYIIYHI